MCIIFSVSSELSMAALVDASPGTTTRSLLTTVFGDALLPRRQPSSVVDLALLVAPLGVNERAVRTTLLRLSRDGLVMGHREGRRSLYAVAPTAIDTFRRAETRIYECVDVSWDQQWTMALIDPASDSTDRARLQRCLLYTSPSPRDRTRSRMPSSA